MRPPTTAIIKAFSMPNMVSPIKINIIIQRTSAINPKIYLVSIILESLRIFFMCDIWLSGVIAMKILCTISGSRKRKNVRNTIENVPITKELAFETILSTIVEKLSQLTIE